MQRYLTADSVDAPQRPTGDTRPHNIWRQPSTFDVLDVDATDLCSVTLPFNTHVAEARGHRLWVIVAGEEEEDFVAWYRTGGDES